MTEREIKDWPRDFKGDPIDPTKPPTEIAAGTHTGQRFDPASTPPAGKPCCGGFDPYSR
jgi:hypothetical protein